MLTDSSRKSLTQKKKLRPDMISRPQNDLRHTGHIGYDGAIFGDVSFIGDNYDKLPVKVVSPCKCACLPVMYDMPVTDLT